MASPTSHAAVSAYGHEFTQAVAYALLPRPLGAIAGRRAQGARRRDPVRILRTSWMSPLVGSV